MLTDYRTVIVVLVAAAATFLTRLFPFALFGRNNKEVPHFIRYLGDILPLAIIGALIVYCLSDFISGDINVVAPKLIGVTATAIIHYLKKNTLLSISVGTIGYMLLIHFVFI